MFTTKYRALRAVRSIYEILGLLIAVFGGLASLIVMFSPSVVYDTNRGFVSGPPMIGQGIALLLGVVVAGIGLFAVGQLIQLLIDVEENTRITRLYFETRLGGARSRPADHHPLLRNRDD